ncbi:MAG TPA: TerB family tellurite resistance protein [Anaeromyxobacteraceae bacterium]|nr:TerB family tellurite resistance protein [Anaeromyxobacteraceae bacterium]
MSILEWLGLAPAHGGDGDPDAIRRIERELDSMDPARARYLALFAFLLARVADVDLNVTDAETREMEKLVEEKGGLPPPQAALVVAIAKAENRLFGATQNFLAAREFRDLASDDRKRELLDCLFAVAAADGAISVAEEEAIREISRELLLGNDEYLAIRGNWRDYRAVLKKE